MIKLTPHKKHVIPYTDPDDAEQSFSITWQFPLSTLSETDEIRKKFNKQLPDGNRDKIFAASIKEQTGFVDEKGEPLIVQDPEDYIPEEGVDSPAEVNRAAIYDYVKGMDTYMIDVMLAYIGPRAKNLLAGATQALTGSGVSTSAQTASNETNV